MDARGEPGCLGRLPFKITFGPGPQQPPLRADIAAALERPGVTEAMREFAHAWPTAPRAADVVPSFFEMFQVPEHIERALDEAIAEERRRVPGANPHYRSLSELFEASGLNAHLRRVTNKPDFRLSVINIYGTFDDAHSEHLIGNSARLAHRSSFVVTKTGNQRHGTLLQITCDVSRLPEMKQDLEALMATGALRPFETRGVSLEQNPAGMIEEFMDNREAWAAAANAVSSLLEKYGLPPLYTPPGDKRDAGYLERQRDAGNIESAFNGTKGFEELIGADEGGPGMPCAPGAYRWRQHATIARDTGPAREVPAERVPGMRPPAEGHGTISFIEMGDSGLDGTVVAVLHRVPIEAARQG